MHGQPVDDENDGEFSEWQHAVTHKGPWTCIRCGAATIYFRVWESHDGGHQDIQYHCRSCGRRWWVEGDDG